MAQVSIMVKCRICENPIVMPPDTSEMQGLIYIGQYIINHHKCETDKALAEAAKKVTALDKKKKRSK